MSRSEHDQRIAEMFDRVAPRYEPLNRLLSFGRDVGWRARAVELARLGANEIARVVGVDISSAMLDAVVRRADIRGERRFAAILGTAHALPFADASFDRVVAGFTVRNFGDLASGLREMRRVLRPSGRAVILELSTPPNALVRAAYGLYFHRISPLVAAMAGGDPEAYRYQPLTLGIAAIHVGEP